MVVRAVGIRIGAPGHAGEVQASALGGLEILVVRGRGGRGGEGHKQEGEDKRLGTNNRIAFCWLRGIRGIYLKLKSLTFLMVEAVQ